MKYCNYCMILMTIISIVIIKVVHAAHGDNMLCEGCGAVMEHVYHDVLKYAEERGKSIDMTQGETVTVDFTERVKKICDQKEFTTEYNRNVRSACWEMCHKFPNVISNVFGGDEPNERSIYPKTYKACVEILDYCDKIDENYVDKLIGSSTKKSSTGKKLSTSAIKCNRCRTVVSDIVHVVNRKSSWDFFRTKEHIYSVLDSICNGIVYRYPESLTNILSEMCSDIIESYEHEIAQVLIDRIDDANDLICGKEISNFCPSSTNGNVKKKNKPKDPNLIWESPFHRIPLADFMGNFDPFQGEEEEEEEETSDDDADEVNVINEEEQQSEAADDVIEL